MQRNICATVECKQISSSFFVASLWVTSLAPSTWLFHINRELSREVIEHAPLTPRFVYSPGVRVKGLATQKASHSGLLEPLGSSTVRKEPGVLDKTTWSVMP